MVNLTTKFVGLELKSPIIAGSCGVTANIERMVKLEKLGIGAVVLKSIFEEQIDMDIAHIVENESYPEAADYIRNYLHVNTMQQYVDLVREAKKSLTIPVIASINCLRSGEWIDFSRQLEEAGADAIELNIFVLPLDEFKESTMIEQMYYDVVKQIKAKVNIPIIVKIGRYYTNIIAFVEKLKAYGADAVTLFNRFYEPDIDINRIELKSAKVFSVPEELHTTLRWTGILAGKDKKLQLSASTGVHDGKAAVKLLLAGATTVQVCSVLYERGNIAVQEINHFMSEWMEKHSFRTIGQFRGQLSYCAESDDVVRYERAQFMKYFSDKEI